MSLFFFEKKKKISIYIFAALISLFLSYDSSLRGAVINPDGICYLQSAEAIATTNLSTAMHLCGQAQWPFYSILIYNVVALTNISYISAAFVLNGFFSLISVVTFIYLIGLISASRRVLWCAAAVILLSHEFNSVREYVIRDHGFWAFYLVSIVCLIKFFKTLRWRYALLWSLFSLLAMLFRIEGGVFLLFVPLSALLYFSLPLRQRLKAFFQLNFMSILLVALFAIWLGFFSHQDAQLSRIAEIQFHLIHGLDKLTSSFEQSSTALGQHVLSPYAARDASFVLLLMLGAWYIASVISNVSIVYAALIIFAWIRKAVQFDKPTQWVVWSYVIINVLITMIFLVENMFLAKRYLIALSLILMVWVPFALDNMFELRRRFKWLLPSVIVLMLLTALGGIFDFGYSKSYIRYAGEWLAKHVPANAVIYSNDTQVMYYSKHFGNDIFIKGKLYSDMSVLENGKWKQFDYIALHLDSRDKEKNAHITNEIALSPTHVYANKRGDQVIIYQVEDSGDKK